MFSTAILYFLTFCVGITGGCTGTGGIIIVPLLMYIGGMGAHLAMGTTLYSFIFTSALTAWLYARKGEMDWPIAFWLVVGAVPFSYGGAMLKAILGGPTLNLLLALVILVATGLALHPVSAQGYSFMRPGTWLRALTLTLVGAASGLVTGLTGAGGGSLSIALMMLLGVPPLAVVAASQAFGLPSTIAGTIGNLQNNAVDFQMGNILAGLQVIGTLWGVHLAHKLNTAKLRLLVIGLCLGTGLFILIASLKPFIFGGE